MPEARAFRRAGRGKSAPPVRRGESGSRLGRRPLSYSTGSVGSSRGRWGVPAPSKRRLGRTVRQPHFRGSCHRRVLTEDRKHYAVTRELSAFGALHSTFLLLRGS